MYGSSLCYDALYKRALPNLILTFQLCFRILTSTSLFRFSYLQTSKGTLYKQIFISALLLNLVCDVFRGFWRLSWDCRGVLFIWFPCNDIKMYLWWSPFLGCFSPGIITCRFVSNLLLSYLKASSTLRTFPSRSVNFHVINFLVVSRWLNWKSTYWPIPISFLYTDGLCSFYFQILKWY